MVKYLLHPLIKALRDLQAYCELIIFTYLPRDCLSQILDKIPDLKNLFSYVFTKEDLVPNEDKTLLIKDLSKLLFSRTLEEIIVVEVDQDRVDQNYLSSVIILPYDGSLNYTQLIMLKSTIKALNGEYANSSSHLPKQSTCSEQVSVCEGEGAGWTSKQ